MGYKRLTQQERYHIDVSLKSGISQRTIAAQLNRNVSTISREIRRNSGKTVYGYCIAERRSRARRRSVHPPMRIVGRFKVEINELLNEQWSPEQISGRLAKSGTFVSHETIYRYVYMDRQLGGSLYKNLRRKRKWRRSHKSSYRARNKNIRDQVWICDRPKIVEERSRLGDFERDTMLGKRNESILLTAVDRKSKLLRIKKLPKLSSQLTHRATVDLLKDLDPKTITNDNGPEFNAHAKTTQKLNAKVFFNDPYSAWQRGTNENIIGLIRQYFPKGTDLNAVSYQKIKAIEDRINNRPRKTLGFLTPNEVHRKQSQGVALRY